jgi:phosphoglycolate phosphatase-like HAD superfamily hydrolase
MAMTPGSSDPFSELDRFQLLILDLDGTLYDEAAYLRAAYSEIARTVEARTGVPMRKVEDFLHSSFVSQGRSGLFDRMCAEFGLAPDYLAHALSVLRGVSVTGGLSFHPPMAALLDWALNRSKSLAVLTNGNVAQQRNKIAQLCLPQKVRVYFANEIAPKPSPLGIERILKDHSCAAESAVLIGDDIVDEQAAMAAGIAFRHVRPLLDASMP